MTSDTDDHAVDGLADLFGAKGGVDLLRQENGRRNRLDGALRRAEALVGEGVVEQAHGLAGADESDRP